LNPDKLRYKISITDRNGIEFENINSVREAIYEYGEK